MSKFLNNINLEAANDIQFKTTAGANAGKIEQDGNNLVLSNAVGDVLLGDGSSDVYIGDGTNNVDILFEQSGSIKGDGSAVTLTIGGANTTLNLENPNINGTLSLGSTSINNKLTFTTANGYILFDHEPSGDTGAYEGTTSVPLLKIDRSGSEKTILERISQEGGILLGADDSVIIAAGDTRNTLRSNLNEADEKVVFASEAGFHAYGFPSNDTTWSNRNEFRFRSDSATASDNGLYIGDGTNVQFIDLNRNLKNIGTIGSGTITSTGNVSATSFIKSGGTTNQFLKANGNVDGTAYAPLASPALTGNPTAPTQAANNNSTRIATTAYVQTEISDLIGSAPAALDTLNELAAAINDDSAFSSTVTTSLGNRLRVDTASQGLNSTQKSNARTNLGLGSAATQNTSAFATAAQGSSAETAYGWGDHSGAGYLTSSSTQSKYLRSDASDSFSGKLTGTATNENLEIGGIRGTAKGSQTGDYIHLYERVHIGGPSGWGHSTHGAPSNGLSVWGAIDLGMGGSGALQVDGTTVLTNARVLQNVTAAAGIITSGTFADARIASASNWNTAYTDRNKWDGGSTGLNASTGRTSLGLGSAATQNTSAFATASHNHDDRYYTETETNGFLNLKANLNGATFTGDVTVGGILKDGEYHNAGSANWKTKKYIRSVGVTGADIGGVWVYLARVVLDSAYEKARIKFNINSYDDVASGVEAIDVSYENHSTGQEHHILNWYTTDNNATTFSEVRSIRSSSSGLSNTYDLYVQMSGDWRDTFTVVAESWVSNGSSTPITFPTSAGSSTAPTAGSDDKAATSREWYTSNSQMYSGSNKFWHAGNDGSGSGLDADTLDGLQLNSDDRNDSANVVCRTQGNGYAYFGWINTTSGNNSTTAISRIYASHDGFIRYYTPANFGAQIGSHISYNDLTNKPSIPSLSGYATESYVGTQISNLVNGAPAALDTLNELAAAIDDNASYAASITTALAGKQVAGTYNTIIGTDSDINTSGATVIDQLNMTDGVIQSHSTRTLTLGDLGYTGATNANNYSLPAGSSSTRGGFKIGYTESGKYYPVEVDSSEKMFVNVPWTDTNTNTTYSAGTGITLSGTTFSLTDTASKLNTSGGTLTGDLTIGNGSADTNLHIKKSDNNVSDHIVFYNGTTRVGEIGVEDGSWLRLNQETANNIYTPRMIRADGGFLVDGTSKGIDGSGNFFGGTITGASDANVSNWNTAYGWGNHASAGYVTSSGNTVIGTDSDINTSGATVVDQLNMTDGVIQSHSTRTLTLANLGYTGATNANNYSLPAGSSSTRGGFKIGFSESGKNYPVETSSEKMYVNVPWTDTNTDTNTTYSAGRGLDLSGTEFQLETDLRDSINLIGLDSNDYLQWSNNSYLRSVVAGVERFRVNTSGIDVTGTATANAFRTDTGNTDYNVFSRNSTSTTLWVQAAQSGSLQGIASFRYGSATVNQGTEVCAIRRNSSYFINTKLGVGTSSPSTALHVSGTITHTIYNATSLPSASPAGQRAFAYSFYPLATSHGSVVSTNGSYVIPVYSDGSSWRAG